MSPEELEATLDDLRLSQREAGLLLGKSDRAIRLWLRGTWPVPTLQARVLRLMRAKKIAPADLLAAESASRT